LEQVFDLFRSFVEDRVVLGIVWLDGADVVVEKTCSSCMRSHARASELDDVKLHLELFIRQLVHRPKVHG
jgi:hypothetical protein